LSDPRLKLMIGRRPPLTTGTFVQFQPLRHLRAVLGAPVAHEGPSRTRAICGLRMQKSLEALSEQAGRRWGACQSKLENRGARIPVKVVVRSIAGLVKDTRITTGPIRAYGFQSRVQECRQSRDRSIAISEHGRARFVEGYFQAEANGPD